MRAPFAAAALLSAATLLSAEAPSQQDPFAAFKEDVVDTECVVERIDKFPSYGSKVRDGGAPVTDAEAAATYDCAKDDMLAGYGRSGYAAALNYQSWPVFSTGPYRSRSHSKRLVSNYANDIAAPRYGRYEQAGTMPVGSLLAKDSFVISETGRVVFGSLGLMEKMPAGFSPDTGDWRFTMILPDGRLFGETGSDSDGAVKFCADCHRDAGIDQDFMLLLPAEYRR